MGGLHGQLLYFAYGADLRREALARRCPGADWLGVASLEGHRFVMGAHGAATVRAEEKAAVWGTLWLVPAEQLETLDELAGVAEGRSERTTRRIISPAGPRTEAMMYVSPPAAAGVKNTAGYMSEVIEGARENRFPAAYIKELQSWVKAGGRAGDGGGKDSR